MNHPIRVAAHLVERELRGFKREIESYPDDETVWATPPGVANSAGTLTLHCTGNIQHFIGARLGNTGYVRDRPAEFSRRSVPRSELLAEIDRAIDSVRHTLSIMTDNAVPVIYPEQFAGKPLQTEVALAHLTVHLAYHLGQVDYHRRLITGDPRTLNQVAPAELPGAEDFSA